MDYLTCCYIVMCSVVYKTLKEGVNNGKRKILFIRQHFDTQR